VEGPTFCSRRQRQNHPAVTYRERPVSNDLERRQ
jgi:hypothetical protein